MAIPRRHGFESEAQWREHLAETDDVIPREHYGTAREMALARLSDEVAVLRSKVAIVGREVAELDVGARRRQERHVLLKVVATAIATVLLGRLASALRLGAVGTALAPFAATKLIDRFGRRRWL